MYFHQRIKSEFRVLGMHNFASSSNPAFIKEVVLLLSSYGAKKLCLEITDFLVLNSPAVRTCTVCPTEFPPLSNWYMVT